jgi:lipopolysaccharide biosynthesis glycosyltransferase
MKSNEALFCNMYIMKKEYFYEYCKFNNDILTELEKIIDLSDASQEERRFFGHISERLLGVYINYITKTRKANILYTGRTFYSNTKPLAKVTRPKFDKCISLMLACSNEFMKYTCVLLESIKENINSNFNYDIVITHRGISEYNQHVAKSIFINSKNVLLRFVDVTKNFEKYTNLYVDRHITLETYYRFLLVDLFQDYERILYLDCDMIVNSDVSDLFFTDLEGYYIAAVRDYDFIAGCKEIPAFYKSKILDYVNVENVSDYFQAGVILFNLKEIRKDFSADDLFQTALERNWYYVDQDVLNCLFNGRVKYLDTKWNVFSLLEKGSIRENRIKNVLQANFSEDYYQSSLSPCIIHYAGVPKVWLDTDVDLSHIFWKYARNSPFYESLLSSLINGEGVMHDWVVFIQKPDLNIFRKFFSLFCIREPWASTYCTIDFTYLSNHCAVKNDVLVISTSTLNNENGGTFLRVNDFYFKNNIPIFANNIVYEVDNLLLNINVRQFEQYAGFAFKVRTLESRSVSKPVIKVLNHHYI